MAEDNEGPRKKKWRDMTLDERLLASARGAMWDEYKIRLKGGTKLWPLMDAECALGDLQDMQSDRPEEFAALVGLVRPKSATRLPDTVPFAALQKLRKANIVQPDGSVDRLFAAMLDAAYTETKEGVTLSNPITYPSPEVFAERERMHGGGFPLPEFERADEQTKRAKKRDGNDGPAR